MTGRQLIFVYLAAARACLSQRKTYPSDKLYARILIEDARRHRKAWQQALAAA